MKSEFTALFQHDAIIRSLSIDRSKPGLNDVIRVGLFLPQTIKYFIIEFHDCYAFKTTMKFGIQAEESISYTECISDSSEINDIIAVWSKIGVDIRKIQCYRIQTNSTNSEIKIFSLGYRVYQEK